ncbi:hypothetical protein NQ317_003973 [Molorchus minor]|uniref:DDE Tnp4 domain-containing protein n=1 Tax=Molorchus minor TaxID=1323400 RepID=A0ABQ9JGG5_9CUCU|nr:hypothetical protein NQ317_003973 [Molorchus minor]
MNYFKGDDNFTLYYTGLPEFKYVKCIYDAIETYLPSISAIPKFSQLILTLIKLRLNTPFKDLGFRFHIHHTTAARIFYRTIDILYYRLKSCIIWPEREDVMKNMPFCFQEHFGKKATVIIDCFEIFIERSSNLDAAAKTWSNYKHHHTIKFLIGITPQGAICFISNAYGGRASDKFITENSNFLDKLRPGDLVIADRGFLISNSVKMCFAEVVTPSFTKGRKQLSAKEIETTRKTASVRIHVERVIGMLRQKYTILKDTLPLQALKEKSIDEQFVLIDQIVVVCCALINLSPPIIPLQ